MGWTDKGSGNRTLATTISKNGVNNFIYGDDAHTDAATSELAFAGVENDTNFQNTFEFEAPEWITGISAVENANSSSNQKYYNLKFNVSANGEGNPARTGNIIIKYHEQTLTLTVNQEAGGTAPTGFILYMNSDSNYSDTLAAIKVNGNSVTPPASKSIQIFTSATPPSTNPGQITIEIQPLDPSGTSKTFYLSFNTNTSYNNDNIVYNNFTGYWCDAFYPTTEPACYIFGDVVFSKEAIQKIVDTQTDDIEFFASAPPFAKNYVKEWAEPFALKVVDQEHLKASITKTKKLDDIGAFNRRPIMWELWQVIKKTPLNRIDYSNYTVINDWTCDIDTPKEISIFEKIVSEVE